MGTQCHSNDLKMCFYLILIHIILLLFSQKMDKNKDGVVTLEEFVIACQEVCIVLHLRSIWHYKKYKNILITVTQMKMLALSQLLGVCSFLVLLLTVLTHSHVMTMVRMNWCFFAPIIFFFFVYLITHSIVPSLCDI